MITYYFHVSKDSRKKYKIDANLFAQKGNLVITDFRTARLLSEKINKVRRDEGKYAEQVTAGQINALGLMHEIYHLLIRKYEETNRKNIFNDSYNFLKKNLTEEELEKTLLKFVEEFPPLQVYKNIIDARTYLNESTENKSNREIILEELIILNLENINPATRALKELYTDEVLLKETKYKEIIEHTELFFESAPKIGGFNLISFLRRPIIQSPYNIEEQLDFIRTSWINFIDEELLNKILLSKDLIHEDYKLFVQHGGGEKGTPPVPDYQFDRDYYESLKIKLADGKKLSPEEYEYYQLEVNRFTQDIEWMPRVVMIAKNAFVWLYQLSKKYNRPIKHLDEIPDEELDRLSRWNFTALWLIGIWERSSASKKIKQMMGNPEAASSAYSLYDYIISSELGGEPAFENLKTRAWQRGIRLSSDMVPNHTGIYSKWVVEKPDYFIQTPVPPFPNYRFTGPNLSDDARVEVRIEDQYYSRTDAAVVFERLDRYTGSRAYIYHGNDGTNMPWNDTAQLDLMKTEVRESLIQTIMHVARKTPIIRFDAAMTLAKKHYQRLWFPIPGSGGAIPSRTDYSMTRSQFDAVMPQEFWREVVDRINHEMPNTLLLAEAFWLMEGYFVRTLGMHRVYNSAFMHMFMKEENDKYRLLIKNTLAFNPEILKRYVNFMSNPDEETAVNQFGKGDKYFGVATMLITLPGLPMFAHGQIEGYAEKYGMEYQRSYYEEFIDEHLVERHQQEIFPLLQKRYLFSQVESFEFYDFNDEHGNCNENVFAFSNKIGNERSLVIYNNSYSETYGSINYSCEKSIGEEGRTSTTSIEQALGINNEYGHYYIFKDFVQQLEYIISGSEISSSGFQFHLTGYQRKVLIDFREVYDFDGRYKSLSDQLNGNGIPSVEHALNEMNFAPFHNSLVHFFTSIKFSKILLAIDFYNREYIELPEIDEEIYRIYNDLKHICKFDVSSEELLEKIITDISLLDDFNSMLYDVSSKKSAPKWINQIKSIVYSYEESTRRKDISFLLFNIVVSTTLKSVKQDNPTDNIFDRLYLWKPFFEISGFLNYYDSGKLYELSKVIYYSELLPAGSDNNSIKTKSKTIKQDNSLSYLINIFSSDLTSKFLQVNEYLGTQYFNKERIEDYLRWIFIFSIIEIPKSKSKTKSVSLKQFTEKLKSVYQTYLNAQKRIEQSDYKLDNLLPHSGNSPEIKIDSKSFKSATSAKRKSKTAQKKAVVKKKKKN